MINTIYTLSELKAQGKHIARLEGNRNLNPKAVKAKMKSMAEVGMLIPAIIVDAQKAIESQMAVVDFETGKEIDQPANYVVLLDANHRFQAYLNLKKEDKDFNKDFYLAYSLNEDAELAKILSEINIATNPWKGGDYVKGATMMVKGEYPLLTYLSELTSEGYSLDAASKWATFRGISKATVVKAMNGKVDEVFKDTTGLDRGKQILKAAKKPFNEKFLQKRTLIDWIISKYNTTADEDKAHFTEDMVYFLEHLEAADVKTIQEAKGTRGGQTRDDIINNKLNVLWAAKN